MLSSPSEHRLVSVISYQVGSPTLDEGGRQADTFRGVEVAADAAVSYEEKQNGKKFGLDLT